MHASGLLGDEHLIRAERVLELELEKDPRSDVYGAPR
jgi:hypothetical protein